MLLVLAVVVCVEWAHPLHGLTGLKVDLTLHGYKAVDVFLVAVTRSLEVLSQVVCQV